MAGGRNYTLNLKIGEDGTHYVRIREVRGAASRPARRLAESLNSFKSGFQRTFRFVSRRA